MRKREHLKKLKKDKLEAQKWLPALLNMNKDDIEKERFIEARLQRLKDEGFYPFDIADQSVLEHLKKHPVFGAKHILDLFEFRDILIAIVSWKSGNIRIFTRIFSINEYISRGRQWRSKLAGDVMDAWFKNHKFRYQRNTFEPEVESYTDELKLRLARFLTDFSFEQNLAACESCGAYFLRNDLRLKTCARKECSARSLSERRARLKRIREKRMREFWELTAKQNKSWQQWRKEYRSNIDGAKSAFISWYVTTYAKEFSKMKSYSLFRDTKYPKQHPHGRIPSA